MFGLGTLYKKIFTYGAILFLALMVVIMLLRNQFGGAESFYFTSIAICASLAAAAFFFLVKCKARAQSMLRAQFSGTLCAMVAIFYAAKIVL